MSQIQILQSIKDKKWLIFWLTILGAFLAFDVMVIQAPEYKASAKVLVVQTQTLGQDIYSISKSAQTLAKVLEESIYSDSFFEKVIASSQGVALSDFPSDAKERREEWEDMVKVDTVRDLGFMEISVLYPQRDTAERISRAIVEVLKDNHQLYHGAGSSVEIRVMDYPLAGDEPVTLKLYLATILGGLIGLLIGLGWTLRKVL